MLPRGYGPTHCARGRIRSYCLFEKVSLPRVPRKKGGREERWREGEKRFCGIVEGARQKQKHVSVCVSVVCRRKYFNFSYVILRECTVTF